MLEAKPALRAMLQPQCQARSSFHVNWKYFGTVIKPLVQYIASLIT